MSNIRSLIIGIFVIIVLIVGAIVLVRFLRSGKNTVSKSKNTVAAQVTANPSLGAVTSLEEQHKSKTNGISQLEELNGQVRVHIKLSQYPADTLQSANIYMGTCDKPGSVLYTCSHINIC